MEFNNRGSLNTMKQQITKMNQVISSLSNLESPSNAAKKESYLMQKRIQNKIKMQEHQ